MAELLVRIIDHASPDRHGRGDVIVAFPDGHSWSERERSNPDWAILAVPGLDPAEVLALMEVPDADPGTAAPGRRRRHIDLDALQTGRSPQAIRAATRTRTRGSV